VALGDQTQLAEGQQVADVTGAHMVDLDRHVRVTQAAQVG